MVMEPKQCVVFGIWWGNRSGYDWYGFDSLFSLVEALKGSYDSEDNCGYDSDDVGHIFFEFDIFNQAKLANGCQERRHGLGFFSIGSENEERRLSGL
ncbi:unnamed protein product [Cuscuta campestris]|uniref:Uncharacterized protein n=1 Tax=Cuscuta campestris TaxID=132261 RepID=A0A484N2C0_9ASTE|nr:unnamed protein product [Cuscuta campestris]